MTADDVRDTLALRWPDAEYLHVNEAPQEASRGGRKIDRLVVSLWPSRGLALDGVEIKVSASDWRRELKHVAKAEWWWQHVNRFWVAAPASLAEKIQPDLPPTWGLLGCERGERPKVVVEAPHHDAAPMPWTAVVGILRAAADCGVNALWRAEERGRQRGRTEAEEAFARRDPDNVAREQLERLRQRVKDFEDASGISISSFRDEASEVGALVALARKELYAPGWTLRAVIQDVELLKGNLKRISKSVAEVEKFGVTLESLAADARNGTTPEPARSPSPERDPHG